MIPTTTDTRPVMKPVGPLPDDVDLPYWEGLLAGELRIQRCPDCQRWHWGPTWVCKGCYRFDPVWEPVEARGRVYAYTQTHHVFPTGPAFAGAVPYSILLVELPHCGGVRLLGMEVEDDPADPPVVGDEVEGVIQPPSDDSEGWAVLRWRRIRTDEEAQQ